MIEYPQRIADAARKRINSVAARKLQTNVTKAFAQHKPANAEPDLDRRIERVQAVTGANESDAKKILAGQNPAKFLSGDELFGAERLIGNTVDFLPASFLIVGRKAAATVARVIQPTGEPVATGFMISDSLFMTNNHVIGSEQEAAEMLLEFDFEKDPQRQPLATTRFALDSTRLFLTSNQDDLDFTIVAVGNRVAGAKTLADFGYCPLSARGDKHMLGEFVNVIEHPAGDYKQVVLRENKLVSRLDTVLHYEADTEPGSSGSPVFNDEWEVIALHHWGGPHRQQRTAGGQPVPSAVNEGIRISAILEQLGKAQLPTAQKALLRGALEAGHSAERPTPVNVTGTPVAIGFGASVSSEASSSPNYTVIPTARVNPDGSSTVSLDINVRLTDRTGSRILSIGGIAEKLPPDPNYVGRRGYAPDFLPGFPIPFPKVTADAPGEKAKLLAPLPQRDPYELEYEHFNIVLNKSRKLPYVTAANIDGQQSLKVDRKTGLVAQGNDGDDEPEASERWFVDPRLASADQTSQALYDHQTPRVFDRGHQVRREDPVWGNADSAQRANADTFHFTNCCPQEFRFNEQVRYWAGIENYVLDNARAEQARVSVFTGPIFAATDPTFRGIRVPMQFYKVIARVEDGQPKATAFLASQAELISSLPERLSGAETFAEVGRVREYLTSVTEIEEMTGLDFGPLREHDTFAPESLGARLPLLKDEDLRAALGGGPSTRIHPAGRTDATIATGRAERVSQTFSAASLSATSFDWRTALATVLASQVAYSDEATIRTAALGKWGLSTFEFISAETPCFVASTTDTALITFRGTASNRNWLTDFDFLTTRRPYGLVHRGFFRALEDVQDRLLHILSALNKRRVVVTGHSLGGALAAMFAAEAPAGLPVISVYTYGQPRVGVGNDFAAFVNDRYGSRFVRIVNNNDIVPRVPPAPFVHVGRVVQFDASGNVSGDSERLALTESATDRPPPLTPAEFQRFQDSLRAAERVASPAETIPTNWQRFPESLQSLPHAMLGSPAAMLGNLPITPRNAEVFGNPAARRLGSPALGAVGAEGLFPSVSDHHIENYVSRVAAQVK